MIELVVFDLAGTTVDDGDTVHAAFRAALAGHGLSADHAAISAVMGLPKPLAIRRLIGESAPADLVDTLHADFTQRLLDGYAHDPDVREIAGASAAFAALRAKGVRIGLDTGFFRPIADVLLARLGWQDIPNVTSDEVPHGRPAPDMVQHLMARLGVSDPKRVAKVGDTRADLEEGTNAGCGLVVGVLTGSFSREQLEACPHTHIVGSVADVPALLANP